MDPNENLKQQLELVAKIRSTSIDEMAGELAELVSRLDEWLSKDGVSPERWESKAIETKHKSEVSPDELSRAKQFIAEFRFEFSKSGTNVGMTEKESDKFEDICTAINDGNLSREDFIWLWDIYDREIE